MIWTKFSFYVIIDLKGDFFIACHKVETNDECLFNSYFIRVVFFVLFVLCNSKTFKIIIPIVALIVVILFCILFLKTNKTQADDMNFVTSKNNVIETEYKDLE